MRMYSRSGGIRVADSDAIATTDKFPLEWTLKPWTRPAGRVEVFIPPDWETHIVGDALVELARSTFPNNGAGAGIDTSAQATAAITEYLAGTIRPAS